jgi:hypothetical protein
MGYVSWFEPFPQQRVRVTSFTEHMYEKLGLCILIKYHGIFMHRTCIVRCFGILRLHHIYCRNMVYFRMHCGLRKN